VFKYVFALLVVGCALLGSNIRAADSTIVGLTASGKLVTFNSATPSIVSTAMTITGLQAGEELLGIDFRPANGTLYGVTSGSRVYTINISTGVATQVGTTQFTPAVSGTNFGVDFNPTVDRIRVVGDTTQNLRLNPDTGAAAANDTALNYIGGDPAAGTTPNIVAVAYTRNFVGGVTTELFGIDATRDTLVLHSSPNTGVLTTRGSLGVSVTGVAGLDIDRAGNTAFAALQVEGATTSGLYTINTTTGAATLVSAIGSTELIRDISVAPEGGRTLTALTSTSQLVNFYASAPLTTSSAVTLSGLQGGEFLLGIDYRPATGELVGIGSTSRVYTIDTTSGVATQVGTSTFTPAVNGNEFGVDFNPTVDRIRLTSDLDQNLRLNPATGATAATDTNLIYNTTDPAFGVDPVVVASAYTNNFLGATTTTLYDIDANRDVLLTQNPPNSGTLNSVGALGVNIDATTGTAFDISQRDNEAFLAAVLNAGTFSTLYTVNLTTGAATTVGNIGPSLLIDGLSVIPAGVVAFNAAAYSVNESAGTATITVTRTGGSSGVVSVNYAVTAGTAGAADFTASTGVLTFAEGETSKTFNVAILTDTTFELAETVTLTLSSPANGTVLGTQSTATLSILDVNDTDGDGFPNAVETVLGSDPNLASSTPFGGAPAPVAIALTLTSVQIKLNFAKSSSDMVVVKGTLAVPAGFSTAGVVVTLDVGGVVKSFTLDEKGKAKSGNDSFALGKPKDGIAKFTAMFKKGDFAASFADEGLSGDAKKAPKTVLVTVYFNSQILTSSESLEYTGKTGKTGIAK
jgi:hypothetical protein